MNGNRILIIALLFLLFPYQVYAERIFYNIIKDGEKIAELPTKNPEKLTMEELKSIINMYISLLDTHLNDSYVRPPDSNLKAVYPGYAVPTQTQSEVTNPTLVSALTDSLKFQKLILDKLESLEGRLATIEKKGRK